MGTKIAVKQKDTNEAIPLVGFEIGEVKGAHVTYRHSTESDIVEIYFEVKRIK
jgi:predicted RNA binding protein YcfA (HicA-like mRNA interferase family)